MTLLLACLLAMSHHGADPDLWGHVQYGRDLIESGLPETTTYSYTAQGYRWINHENLSELLMAMGATQPGGAALLVFKSLMALMVMLLIYRQGTRRNVSLIPLYFTMLLVACNLMHSWTLRPQLLTYSLFALMIGLLEWCFLVWPNPWPASLRGGKTESSEESEGETYRKRLYWLWMLVPLFVIWTNSHGGFVAGYCILAAYLGLRCLELLVARGRSAWPVVGLIGAILVVTGLATFINPYGLELHHWLLGSLGTKRPEILEWRPPQLLSVIWPAWWLMVAVFAAALVFTRRQRDLTHFAILCLALWQACEHRRHIAFFAILFGFWMPIHVQSLLVRIRRHKAVEADPTAMSPRVRWTLLATLSITIVAMSVGLFSHLRQIRVHKDLYPVSAFQYINDQNLSGNLVLRFMWAQYAIAAFGGESGERPHLDVAFDGRFRTCYPQELADMYFDFAIGDAPPEMRFRSPASPPVDGGRILRYKDPDLVLIDRDQTFSVQVMQEHKDEWTLLYQDELAQLWGRADKYDDPRRCDYVPPDRRVIGDAPQTETVPWPALPRRKNRSVHLVHAYAP